MSTDPSFETLPASVLETHKTNRSDLEGLAERESQREPAIPSHYALSLADLRSGQPAPIPAPIPTTPPPVPPSLPLEIELMGDLEDVGTVMGLCERASEVLSSLAAQHDDPAIEALARRFGSVKIVERGELALNYARRRRSEGASWNQIADELNERAQTQPVYAPLRSSHWKSRALTSLIHARANR